MQEAQCSGNAKYLFHLSDDPNIELIRESDAGATVEYEQNGATFVHPLNSMTPRLVTYFIKWIKVFVSAKGMKGISRTTLLP